MILNKLTVELVPSSTWYSNVRSLLKTGEWDIVRRTCYAKAGNVCEICGDVGTNQGYRHNVECHEIWDYNDDTCLQKLTGFISLCPKCHHVKHLGLQMTKGGTAFEQSIRHLQKVNRWNDKQVFDYVKSVFEKYKTRNSHEWCVEMDYLEQYLNENGINITVSERIQQRRV
jgi:hypothetical protein